MFYLLNTLFYKVIVVYSIHYNNLRGISLLGLILNNLKKSYLRVHYLKIR